MNQKQPSAILNKNGGLHSKRALKKVQELLNTHGLKRAILVHMVLTGSQSVQVYRDTYNDIADHIRDNGSRCEYFGCLEMDEDKGLHAHVYFVIETSKKFPHATLNVSDGEWLHRLADRRSLNRIHIAKPKNKIHHVNGKAQFFARLEEKDGRFADCLERIEYLYKNRSKEKVPSREIYFNSNHKANTAKRVAKNAAPAAIYPIQETIPFLHIGSPMGRAEQSLTEKETQHDRITTPSTGQTSPGHADSTSQGYTSTDTESPASDLYSSSSGPILVSSRSRMRVPAPSTNPGTQTEAIWPGQTHGIAAGPEHDTRSQVRHPGIAHGNFSGTSFDHPGISAVNFYGTSFDPTPTKGAALTPAARYIAAQYEAAVDAQLDLDAMRRFLLARGLKRSPAQVVHELDNVFCFTGYASSHPAPAQADLDAIDGVIDRMTPQEIRRLPIPNPREIPGATRVCPR